MNLFGLEITWARKAAVRTLTLDQLIHRLETIMETSSGVAVTPDSAMESPTVQAIVQAVSGAISAHPVRVLRKTMSGDRTSKELVPNHPVARLLMNPSNTADRVSYWLDATSWLIRYGNYYAFKGRGQTGPIRRLEPLPPSHVVVEQADDRTITYRVRQSGGGQVELSAADVHHVRGAARNGVVGDSPVMDVREAIALEIAAERFGASFFGNGAMPSLVFHYASTFQGHKNKDQRDQFIEEFQRAYTRRGRFRAALLPHGIEMDDPLNLDNDKAQFLQTRQHQRSVIAAAFGVPPHMVGDLTKGTFNNVEQQSIQFVRFVLLRYVRMFEAAMERDLLTQEDRARGIIIRFNLDAALRGEFKVRQEGLKIQREAGVINPNEWREHEGMNPRTDPGGEAYWDKGPSGQGSEEPEPETEPEPESEPESEPGTENPPANGNGDGSRRRPLPVGVG